jgi:hypothetical protein
VRHELLAEDLLDMGDESSPLARELRAEVGRGASLQASRELQSDVVIARERAQRFVSVEGHVHL